MSPEGALSWLHEPWGCPKLAPWALRVPNAGSMSTEGALSWLSPEGAQCWIHEPLGYPRCHVLGVCNCKRKYWDGYCLVNICCVFSWQKWQRKWFCLYANGDLYYYDTEKVNLCCVISLFGTHHTSVGRHECLVLFLFTPWNWQGKNTQWSPLDMPNKCSVSPKTDRKGGWK